MRDNTSQDMTDRPYDRLEDRPLDPRRTALLAYEFWRERGCPEGSPEQDWFLAEEHLRQQRIFKMSQAA
jgi:hypothetical protein